MTDTPWYLPDSDIPCELIPVKKSKPSISRYLKGPLPFSWLRKNITQASDRLWLVLIAYSDMQSSLTIKISTKVTDDAGITNRKTLYRALEQLEERGCLAMERHRGRKPRVTLNPCAVPKRAF